MSSLTVILASAQKMIVQYVDSTLFAFGAIGCLLNIFLFSRRQLRSNSCCIYFLASSVAGLILLSIGIAPQLYALDNSPNPFNTILAFCKARSYLNQCSAMSCRWLLVMACVDRGILSSTNARLRLLSSVKIACRAIILIVIIWLIFPIHTLIFFNIQSSGKPVCQITNNGVALYHSIYTIIMGGVLPPLIMLICTSFIWNNLQQIRHRSRMMTNIQIREKNKRDQQILVMLLVQVLIFIVSAIPFWSYNLYAALTQSVPNKSNNRLAIEAFLKTFTEVFIYLPTTSFYSNTLVSRTFRKELFAVFISILPFSRFKKRQRRVGPSVQIGFGTGSSAIPRTTKGIIQNFQTNGGTRS